MMSKLPPNPKEKEKIAFWLLNPASAIESLLLWLFFLLLPTQLGKHFWPDFSIVSGIRIDYLAPTIFVTDLLLIMLFYGAAVRWLKHQRNAKNKNLPAGRQSARVQFKSKKFLILFICIFLFLIGNLLFSQRPLLSSYEYIKFLEFGLLSIYLARTIQYLSQLQLIALLFAISSFFESILAIAQYINQGSLNGIFYFFGERTFTGTTPGIANASINGTLVLRPYATFPHPNVLAAYLLISMVLVWGFVLHNKSMVMQVVGVICLLITSIALLITLSRVNIFLWGIFISFLFIRRIFQGIKNRKTKLILSAIGIGMVVFISLFPLTHEIFFRFAQTSLTDESITERTELISAAWTMIQQHPFLGIGLGNFIPALAPLQKPLPLGLYLQPVHNIFILIATETGVIGLGLFVWLWMATMRRIKHYGSRIKKTLFSLLLIILVTGLFDHYWLTLQQGQLLFATIIGLSWTKASRKIYYSNGKSETALGYDSQKP